MNQSLPTTSLQFDALGNAVTLSNSAALSPWNETIEAMLGHSAATPAALARTLAAAPDFALGHATKGLMLLMMARGELMADARQCLGTARACLWTARVTARERAYVDALDAWLDGRPLHAADHLEQALALAPRDVLALKFVHQIRFMLGDNAGMLASLRRHAPGFAGTFAESYVLGCQAFAEEETGDFKAAEMSGRRALALNPADAWGRHAVAHVLEMTGRAREGADWLSANRQHWGHCNNFSFHLYWHLALFLIEQGRIDGVLDLYDREIRANRSDDYRDLANGASLLARLEIEGVDIGHRWEELGEIAARRVDDRRLVFADLHYVTALAGAGLGREAGLLVRNLKVDGLRGTAADAGLAGSVGAIAAEGVVAFRAGEFDAAARALWAVRPRLIGIGGSHAQRDLFEQMLIESLMRSGDHDRAERLLTQRLAARGGNNAFAARRLKRIAQGRRGAIRVATLALGAMPIAAAH